eukprot:TRINITY_DN25620_c0_g1_i1.p2 TRINITY_DN25620_c0_g1~~TRINITY_DN25620_c0_g1_i1.p2  ORF type:complete len:140 (-),score=52.54 TRINITY_DN25620_c0_g1_i1:142-561(-)
MLRSLVGSEMCIRDRIQVLVMLLFELTTVVLAPLFSTFVLDEACLRYYLSFDDSIRELFEVWDLAEQGFEAYRPGFCSRRLLSEFSYVWIMLALMSTFLEPTVSLVMSLPSARAMVTKIQSMMPGGLPKDDYALSLIHI